MTRRRFVPALEGLDGRLLLSVTPHHPMHHHPRPPIVHPIDRPHHAPLAHRLGRHREHTLRAAVEQGREHAHAHHAAALRQDEAVKVHGTGHAPRKVKLSRPRPPRSLLAKPEGSL